ncbi:hypothetical protein [uncultured Tessaracoccus sp.]|uniref:hypothetical protein n=1 Tax=uncultured Tessaracoccus sp. TaxID=905023 RepID=UPI0025E75346|nr:hypothetical protein [uncultured Tessaracoccus sp.]
MCTVVVRVGDAGEPVRMLAVRDEDPTRPWRPFGRRWPEYPAIAGVRDELAGGAWLALDAARGRLGVVVNIEGVPDVPRITSRGALALDVALDRPLPEAPTTEGFHLVQVSPDGVRVTTWDGRDLRHRPLGPGTHLVTHAPVDDPRDPRTGTWLPRFAEAATVGEPWWQAWAAVLGESAQLPNDDERAIIRDNHVHGYPTVTLMAAFLEIGAGRTTVDSTVLEHPGRWPSAPRWTHMVLP